MSGDSELERLKAERLAEMRRNMSSGPGGTGPPPPPSAQGAGRTDYRDILVKSLGYRGAEVLQNAESQFPGEAPAVVQQLGRLLESGEIAAPVDGGSLLALFRSVGLGVRMATRISVEQDGKLVPLSDRFGAEKREG